jgi:hypothetical protein
MKESIELSVMVGIIKKRKKEKKKTPRPHTRSVFFSRIERFSQRKSQGVI